MNRDGTKVRLSAGVLLLGALLVGALPLGACSDDDPEPTYSLTLTGTGYTPHSGVLMYVALVNASSGSVVTTNTFTIPTSGAFSTTFSGRMSPNTLYRVDFYADGFAGAAGNGACDAAPADHQWRVPVVDANGDGNNDVSNNSGTAAAVSRSITIATEHIGTFTDVCTTFTASSIYGRAAAWFARKDTPAPMGGAARLALLKSLASFGFCGPVPRTSA